MEDSFEPDTCIMEQEGSELTAALSVMSVNPPVTPGKLPLAPQLSQGLALIQLQIGLLRESVWVSRTQLNFHDMRKLAIQIIAKRDPKCPVIEQRENILLFRHAPSSENLLKRLREYDTIQDGDLIEVVLSGSTSRSETRRSSHILVVQSYRTPTFCNHCGEMLWGLVRQGLKCEACGLDFHKRCVLKLSKDCNRERRRCGSSLSLFQPRRPRTSSLSTQAGGSLEEISMSKPESRTRPISWVERPLWLGRGQAEQGRVPVPHTFHIHTYTKTTTCQLCHRMLKGLFRQGLQCSDCKFNCHRQCEPQVPSDCPGERRTTNGEDSEANSMEKFDMFDTDIYVDPSKCLPLDVKNAEVSLNPDLTDDSVEDQPKISPCFGSNIPLMRVVQSVRHVKRRDSGVLREGWLLHYTSTDTMRKRHYWILDTKNITLYQNENSTKYYKELPLSEVLQVQGEGHLSVPPSSCDSGHSFELVTGTVVYCVLAGKASPAWEAVIRQALMPVHKSGHRGQDCMDLGSQSEQREDISAYYQIFTDDMLGSGQFGIVYGGAHRQSGRTVAVKVIDKTRFPTNQESQLRNEVAILQNLAHPGVVHLEGMFETSEHVFVVMEKLHGDMLEMIMSNENGRLPERNTRFLVTQILEALRYLHFKHIAHCDLKPENVLLACADPFPQVKLCDFGFSRIIGEKSFRRSVVGTPAYLAPEVISSLGYNRSLDMWAVGVVLYVSLSGTFPFNEYEDIGQQITNASFMFPRQPWANISLEAVSLITNLLQVSVKRRFTVGKALGHSWLQDFQLWCDLREFERRMGLRYLTHQDDGVRWQKHAQEKGLDFPSQLA
ncbi:protein kinase D4 [Paramormyrops kingsleyae]|uniref:Protein kinase D4 n=1 Tax=Paramormyrops kingsleyae TaxID=1676925 RepID=A0A3B3T6X5_9TELE|nr:serine/threonine-protein kinase D3-like [Paramormyrops kingsleyae]